MMKRKKIPHFYIALVLIVIITVTTFGTMKMEEDLDNEKYLVKETFPLFCMTKFIPIWALCFCFSKNYEMFLKSTVLFHERVVY